MAFVTTGNEEKKGNKKKEIMCYKCGKSRNYSNECDQVETMKTSNMNNTGKKGSIFLVLKEDAKYSSSEDEAAALHSTRKKNFKSLMMTTMNMKY